MTKQREIDILNISFVKKNGAIVYCVRNGEDREYLVTIIGDRASCMQAATDESCPAVKYGCRCYHITACLVAEASREAWLTTHTSTTGFNCYATVNAAINPVVEVSSAPISQDAESHRYELEMASIKDLRAINEQQQNGLKAKSKDALIDLMMARWREDQDSLARGFEGDVVLSPTRHDTVADVVMSHDTTRHDTTATEHDTTTAFELVVSHDSDTTCQSCDGTTICQCDTCGDALCLACNLTLNERYAEEHDGRCSLCRVMTRRAERLSATLSRANATRPTEAQLELAALSSSNVTFSLMR